LTVRAQRQSGGDASAAIYKENRKKWNAILEKHYDVHPLSRRIMFREKRIVS